MRTRRGLFRVFQRDSHFSRVIVWGALVVLALLIPILYITLVKPENAKAEWWDPTYKYRTPYSFTATSAVSDARKVKFDVDTTTLISAGKLQSDCDDIRFTDATGKLLEYFIDTNTADCNNASTDFYIKVSNVASGGNLIYMYYGNAQATRSQPGGRKNDFFAEESFSTLGVGLKGYWKFNESTANTCQNGTDDSCDSGLNNDALWNGASSTTGKIGNGITPYVTHTRIESSSALAVSAWINPSAVSSTRTIFGRHTNGSDAAGTLRINGGNLEFLIVIGGSFATHATSNTPISTGNWYHVVGTYDGSTVKMYINGSQVYTTNTSGTIAAMNTGLSEKIGSSQSGSESFSGTIDDARIYGLGLTAAQVSAIYNTGNPTELNSPVTYTPSSGPTAATEENTRGPIAYWSFDDAVAKGSGSTTALESVGGNNATFSSDSQVVRATDEHCVINRCIAFVGFSTITVANTISGVKSVSFWFRPGSSTGGLVTLAASGSISYNSTSITTSGITSPTIYVNGKQTSTYLADKWNHVEVTTGTAITANAISLLTAASSTGMDELKFYGYARTAADVKADYNTAAATNVKKNQTYLSDNLAVYYRFNAETSLLNWRLGAGSADSNSPNISYVAGKFWQAATYNGTSAYTWISDNASNSFTGSLTLAAWIKPSANTAATAYSLIGKWDAADQAYLLQQYGDELRLYIGSSSNYQETTSVNLTTGVWYHVAGVYDATKQSIKIYVNGAEVTSTTAGTIPSSITDGAGRFHTGADSSATTAVNFYSGLMDDVRAYNVAKTPDQIRNLYGWVPYAQEAYSFDYVSSTTVYNGGRSHNNSGGVPSYNGTLTNGPTIVTGKIGSAVSLDGTDDYVTFNSSTIGGDCNTANGIFTFAAWIKTTDTTGWIYSRWYESSSNRCFALGLDSGNTLKFLTSSAGTATSDTATGSTIINDNKWHHVAVTKDGTTVKLYVDGRLDGTSTTAPSTLATGNAADYAIGAGVLDASTREKAFAGLIDDVRIYKHVLSGTQVNEVANSSFVEGRLSSNSPAAYWNFDEQQGQVVHGANGLYDGTLGANSSVAADDPTWKTKTDCKVNGCLSFGSTVFANMGNISAANFGTADFSVSGWFNSSNSGGRNFIFSKYTGGGAGRYSLEVGNQGGSGVMRWTDGVSELISNQTTLANGAWHHFAVTRSAGTLYMYIDGKLDTSSTLFSGTLSNTANFKIGALDFGAFTFTGRIDEIKIYGVALTVDQVRLDMNAGAAVNVGTTAASESAELADGPGAAPVLDMQFNEKTGQTAADVSGNGYSGTLGANASVGSDDPTWRSVTGAPRNANGLADGALSFDGSDDYVNISTSATLAGAGQVTISGWIKGNNYASGNQEVFSESTSTLANTRIGLLVTSSSTLRLVVRDAAADPNGSATSITGTTVLSNGQWYYVTAVFDSVNDSHRLYINGALEKTDTTALGALGTSSTAGITIGRLSASNFFNGLIDGVKVYNYARTGAQVAYDYNRGLPMAQWRFDECQGSTANDGSGNGNHLSLSIGASGTQTAAGTCTTSSTAWGNGVTGKYGASLRFDGTDDVATTTPTDTSIFSDTYSYAFWFKASSIASSLNAMLELGDVAVRDQVVTIDGTNSNRLTAVSYPSSGSADSIIGSVVTTGTWYHVVFVRDAANLQLRLYLNGNQAATPVSFSTSTTGYGTTKRVAVGARTNAQRFNGQVDDVRVYNYALSAAQVRKVMNEGAAVRYGQ